MFLLDTNVISELRVGKRSPCADVQRWAAGVVADRLYLSAITVLELEVGVLTKERKDARQGQVLRSWIEALLLQFANRILPFTKTTAALCASLHVPDKRPERDAMIAATAKEHGFAIVTRNVDDFEGCGVELINPWLAPVSSSHELP